MERQLPDPAPLGGRAAVGLLHRWIASRQSPDVKAAIRGFAAAAGIPAGELACGLAMPDALNLGIGLGGRFADTLGCTSVAAWGDYTSDGRLIYGRDLDFPGNGYWDVHPVLARHRPDAGVPYVSVTTAGGIVDGITGLNEEGISVALHQHINSRAGLLGRPILDLAQAVLSTARSLAEAVELGLGWDTFSSWTVVLSDWKRREARAVERSHGRAAVRVYRDGLMVRTNTFEDPELRSTELPYPGFVESSRVRAERARQIATAARGAFGPAELASILSDHLDHERDKVRSFGQTIAQPNNMTSVVFDPSKGELWLADGFAPLCDNPYRRIPLWEGEPGSETLPGGRLPEHVAQGYEGYHAALAAWSRHRDASAALAGLRDAATDDPTEPIYRMLQGLFALKCGSLESALECFSTGAELSDIAHRTRAQRLWKGRTFDLLGRRAEAQREYRAAREGEDVFAPLAKAAAQGLERPYTSDRLPGIQPDMQFADVYRY